MDRRRSQYVGHAVALALIVGIVALISQNDRHDILMSVATGTIFVLIYLIFAIRQLRDYVKAYSWQIYVAGFLAIGIGVATLLFLSNTSIISPTSKYSDTAVGICVGFFVLGIVMVMLPRSVKRFRDVDFGSEIAKQNFAPANSPIAARFSSVDVGLDAATYIPRNVPAFLRIVGPWAVITWGAPLAAVQFVALQKGAIASVFQPVEAKMSGDFVFAVWLLSSILVCWLSIPTAAVAWHRYVLENRLPASPIPIPDRRVVRYLGALWIAAIVFGVTTRAVDFIGHHAALLFDAGSPARIALVTLSISAILFLFLVTPFALRLPFIAINESTDTSPLLLLAARRLGRSAGVGSIIAVAPLAVLYETVSYFSHSWVYAANDISSTLSNFVRILLLFAALSAWLTYISRAYEFVRPGLPQGAREPAS